MHEIEPHTDSNSSLGKAILALLLLITAIGGMAIGLMMLVGQGKTWVGPTGFVASLVIAAVLVLLATRIYPEIID